MKNAKFLYFLLMLSLISCDPSEHKPESALTFHAQNRVQQKSEGGDLNLPADTRRPSLRIEFGGMKLSATIDEIGTVTILNYPDHWEGEAALIRFDGTTTGEEPFSPRHCEHIRHTASVTHSGSFVRNGFHSLVSFEIPAFLSSEFMTVVREAAEAAGLNFSALYLKNPVDKINNHLDLTLSDTAISGLLGNIGALKEQVHLGRKGMEKGPLEKEVILYSADLICDLISGDAKITMTYPISGENRAIKVTYKMMENKLKPSGT